jgi:predicted tellurium resistance membrane protein TerC
LLDIVFSLDSVITAVGMARALWVMIVAMVLAMVVMLVSAGPISGFVERHPTIKILALSFLLLIGVMLVAEGLGKHIEKGYVYFAMTFSLFVELLNMRLRRKVEPVHLHEPTLAAVIEPSGQQTVREG